MLISVVPIAAALQQHPIKKVIVVSSTRVYGLDQGQVVDDQTLPKPNNRQGELLLEMEQAWQQPIRCKQCWFGQAEFMELRLRMIKLAHTTETYPKMHWSNRIHIEDLARFLTALLHVRHR